MASIGDIGKKKDGRGRPKTDATPLMVRVHPKDLTALDAYIAAQPDPKPSRPEAIRALLREGLGKQDAETELSRADIARNKAWHQLRRVRDEMRDALTRVEKAEVIAEIASRREQAEHEHAEARAVVVELASRIDDLPPQAAAGRQKT